MDWFNACDQVGLNPQSLGRPRIVNHGRIVLGDDFFVSSEPVESHLVAERGAQIKIGDGVSMGHGSGIAARVRVEIGSGTRLGAFVLIMDTDYHVPGQHAAMAPNSPIEIGPGVRLKNHVTVLRGASIGEGAVVEDGSVVSGVIPKGAVVAGVPARPPDSLVPPSVEGGGHVARVLAVIQKVLRLTGAPRAHQRVDQLAGWDSLRALALLIALEGEFSATIDGDAMAGATTVMDLARLVNTGPNAASGPHLGGSGARDAPGKAF
jgi:acetyltransferase-like isoleucine patch superfamily enzyme/acyl carrier protein